MPLQKGRAEENVVPRVKACFHIGGRFGWIPFKCLRHLAHYHEKEIIIAIADLFRGLLA